ncbi:hypothetical protein ACNKHS_15485 [Shigella flexneri]
MPLLVKRPKSSTSPLEATPHFDNQPIHLPLDVLLGKTPKMTRARDNP